MNFEDELKDPSIGCVYLHYYGIIGGFYFIKSHSFLSEINPSEEEEEEVQYIVIVNHKHYYILNSN
jgi:hypothetical protein